MGSTRHPDKETQVVRTAWGQDTCSLLAPGRPVSRWSPLREEPGEVQVCDFRNHPPLYPTELRSFSVQETEWRLTNTVKSFQENEKRKAVTCLLRNLDHDFGVEMNLGWSEPEAEISIWPRAAENPAYPLGSDRMPFSSGFRCCEMMESLEQKVSLYLSLWND